MTQNRSKKGKKGLLLIAAALIICAAIAVAVFMSGRDRFGNFKYQVEGGECVITKYLGYGGTVEIPSVIRDKPVTAIGAEAFKDSRMVTRVVIPEGVVTIGDGAFSGCEITSIEIPESVKFIGKEAFHNCSNLESIRIPSGVTEISDNMLRQCWSLTSVTIPEGVVSIGSGAFNYCYNLPEITLPEGLTSIGNMAFLHCESLESIVIPQGVTSIKAQTFVGCKSLTSVVLPKGLTSVDVEAFSGCAALTTLSVPDSVEQIHETAFKGDEQLTLLVSSGSFAERFALEHGIACDTGIGLSAYQQFLEMRGSGEAGALQAAYTMAYEQLSTLGRIAVMTKPYAAFAVTAEGRVLSTTTEIDVSGWSRIVSIACGERFIIGLRSDGTVVAAGDNTYGQCDVGAWTGIVAVAAGKDHALGLRADGHVATAGNNQRRQCDLNDIRNAVAVYADENRSYVILQNGTVYRQGLLSEGYDRQGKFGVEDGREQLPYRNVASLAANGDVLLLAMADGSVVVTPDYFRYWYGGQISSQGFGGKWENTDCLPSTWDNVIAVTVGDNHGAALRMNGTVYGGSNGAWYEDMLASQDWTDVVAITMAPSSGTLLALRADGTLISDDYDAWLNKMIASWPPILPGLTLEAELKSGVTDAGGGERPTYEVGSAVFMGAWEQDNKLTNGTEPIEWLVLDARGDERLLISRYVLDSQMYRERYTEDGIQWADCAIRGWLNGTFLAAAFTDEERARITPTENASPIEDLIFLLSQEQAEAYFPSREQRVPEPTAFAQGKQATGGDPYSWWLRLPNERTGLCPGVSYDGTFAIKGYSMTSDCGIRPAMWVRVDASE